MTRLWSLRLVALAFFAGMTAIDSWFFPWALHRSYVSWYIVNGAIVSALASLFGIVWKDLNLDETLISADPWAFLAANLDLSGSQLQVMGRCLMRAGDPDRRNDGILLDGAAGAIAIAFIAVALVIWSLAILPLQYFVVLFAGAPARLVLKLGADTSKDVSAELKKFQANLAASPVTMTNGIVALSLIGLKWAGGW